MLTFYFYCVAFCLIYGLVICSIACHIELYDEFEGWKSYTASYRDFLILFGVSIIPIINCIAIAIFILVTIGLMADNNWRFK